MVRPSALPCAFLLVAFACGPSAPTAPPGAHAAGGPSGNAPSATSPSANSQNGGRPPGPKARTSALVFEPIGQDLGVVVWPAGTDTTFRFHNPTSKPIRIVDVLAGCGCTSTKLRIVKDGKLVREGFGRGEVAGPLLVVGPGEQGELLVRFETSSLQGNARDHMSRITLATDEKVDPIDLFVKAQIDRIYDVSPPELGFEPMGAKQQKTKEVKIFVSGKGIEPPFDAKVVGVPPGLKAECLETNDGVRPVIWVGVTAGPNLNKAGVVGQVLVEASFGPANAKEKKVIKIQVYVPVVADVFVKPSQLDIQAAEVDRPARSVPVILELLDPDRAYKLGAPRIEGDVADRLKVEVEPIDEGHKYKLTLVSEKGLPDGGTRGFHGLVRIETGLADFPEVRLPYRAYTRPVPPRK